MIVGFSHRTTIHVVIRDACPLFLIWAVCLVREILQISHGHVSVSASPPLFVYLLCWAISETVAVFERKEPKAWV
jgi:D-serine dehydratase